MNFGERMKQIRKEKGLSQRELGEKIGVKQQTIAQYEALENAPKATSIERISEALGVSFHELLTGSPYSGFNYRLFAEIAGLSDKEGILLEHFDQLNNIGQNKALEQIELLTKIPEYQKDNE